MDCHKRSYLTSKNKVLQSENEREKSKRQSAGQKIPAFCYTARDFKEEHSPKFLHDHFIHNILTAPSSFFLFVFFPATSGCGRSCQSWTSLRRRWRWMSWKRRKQTQWMPKLRRSIRKKERKRSLGIWEEFHQGHRLNRRFLWRSGEKNTFELGRYFGKKRWADPGFACIFFFGTDPSEMQWTSRKAT